MGRASSLYIEVDARKSDPQILVINSGSASIKSTLFLAPAKARVPSLERILDAHLKLNGSQASLSISSFHGTDTVFLKKTKDLNAALKLTLEHIFSSASLGFSSSAICAVGHRVVHGGPKYVASTLVTPKVFKELEKISYLAPLHNPACLEGIKCAIGHFSAKVKEIAVFDTAFHSHIPPHASTYAIPHQLSMKYSIKRYGFHGISHEYVWNTYAKHRSSSKHSKVITVHLGSGCSITATKGGISVDTSMGFTPLEGLMMSTRSGDIDPGLIDYLCKQENQSLDELMHLLNFQSGLLGVSGLTSDMKTLLESAGSNASASLAISIFAYRVLKYLGAYISVLGGVDAIIFSGGIGENSPVIREMILKGLRWFGIKLEKNKNSKTTGLLPGEIRKISTEDSHVEINVVGTDENVFIAEESWKIISKTN